MSKNNKNQILLKSGFFENSKILNLLGRVDMALYLIVYLMMLNHNFNFLNYFSECELDECFFATGIPLSADKFIKVLLENDLLKKKNDKYKFVLDKNIIELKKDNTDNLLSKRKEIVDYMNQKLCKHYRPDSANIKKHINARLNEGYAFEDFKVVIDKKYHDWAGTEYEKYLRPETLFGNKFDSYLNQSGGRSLRAEFNNPFYAELLESEEPTF